jgi:hypothetical protein
VGLPSAQGKKQALLPDKPLALAVSHEVQKLRTPSGAAKLTAFTPSFVNVGTMLNISKAHKSVIVCIVSGLST